ncbi:aromatic compound dioxygenase [Clavulina sp. PMI_390]|nr:aromatic compound dioxygenase [Clavulina sp. PMI_390]
MIFSTPLLAIAAQALAVLAHPGHSDLMDRHQLEAFGKRQNDLLKCRSSLQARHEPRMARMHQKRDEILGRQDLSSSAPMSMPTGTDGGPGGGDGGSGATGGGTTASATATAVTSVLTSFPSTTSGAVPASQTTQASDGACALSPQQEEGPYYVAGEALRENLIDNEPGIPFYLEFSLIDTNTCEPLVGAAIDIWSCNATGEYAGFISSDSAPYNTSEYSGDIQHVGDQNDAGSTITDGKTFLRGQQLTDENGTVKFTSLIPGWYSGRAAHVHVRVHVGGEVTANGTYIGGNLTHTGQTFFGEDFYSQVANVYPYSLDTNARTTNDEDRPWSQQNGSYGAWNLYYVAEEDITQGIIGFQTLAVDSTATGQDGV